MSENTNGIMVLYAYMLHIKKYMHAGVRSETSHVVHEHVSRYIDNAASRRCRPLTGL